MSSGYIWHNMILTLTFIFYIWYSKNLNKFATLFMQLVLS